MKTSHTLAAAGEIPRGHGRKCNDIFLCSNLRFAEWESERVSAGERECEARAYLSIGNLWRKQRRLTDWERERERERDSPGKTTCRSFPRAWFYLADEIMSASQQQQKFEWRRACATFALVTIFAFAPQDAIQLRLFSLGNLISHSCSFR